MSNSIHRKPVIQLLPMAAEIGVIDAWSVHGPYFVVVRGIRTYYVKEDAAVDVLYALTEDHSAQVAAEARTHFALSAA
ncbi:MAG: hypothetical protein WD423_12565 [Rhodothermales bacterium]